LTAVEPTDLQRLLLDTPDTVTHFLEELTGEPLVADVVRQCTMEAGIDNRLGVTAGHAITQRIAVLRGRTSDLRYVYAESMFLPDRLPEPARSRLERTNDPIGRILAAHGLELAREALPQPERIGAEAAVFASELVWARAYRLTVGDLPVFAIREWFFRSVLDALGRQARA
jgi:chorismate-pyruvate lyase